MPFRLRISQVSISGIQSDTRGNLTKLGFIEMLTGGRFSDLLIHLFILFSDVLGLLTLNLNRSIKQFIFHTQIKRIKLILGILIDSFRGSEFISEIKTIVIEFLTSLSFALILRITTGLVSFSLVKISDRIRDLSFITKTGHIGDSHNRTIG